MNSRCWAPFLFIICFMKDFTLSFILQNIFADTAVNPIKILVLFISMTILSVFLDEIGFFRFLANVTLKKAGASQKKLFILLYVTVSVLTVFTSNDIIVLTFTPFICYFAANAKIKPLPYLVTVFIAANTWSMALIIGNPTNIYLATSGGVEFLSYVKIMILPTVSAGLMSLLGLILIFRKDLSKPMESVQSKAGHITDPVLLVIGLIHLTLATVMLAVSSYVGIEMWIVALGAVVSLFVCNLVVAAGRRRAPRELGRCLKRAPWTLVPFLLGIFVLILFLQCLGVPAFISKILGTKQICFRYGISSLIACNIMNNIPMSVLFSSIVDGLSIAEKTPALFATIIGSNLGAFLTPSGALAGLMWQKILKGQGIKFGYWDFVKYGGGMGVVSLLAAVTVLSFVV